MALFDHLVFINPHIAVSRQHVDVRPRFPVCVRLASIGIAERNMHAGKFFILQQNSDHPREPEICSKRQFAHAVAILVRVAILPEFFFQIFSRTVDTDQSPALNLHHQRRGLQISILPVEVGGRGCSAHKRAVHGRRSSKDLARRQIRPILRADEPAGLHPIQLPVKVRAERRTGIGLHRQSLGALHALAQPLTQFVHLTVVGTHALLHDLWRYAHHVRVADLPPFHHPHNGHSRAQLTRLGRHAQGAHVGFLERFENRFGRSGHRARSKILEEQARESCSLLFERLFEARSNAATYFIGDHCDFLARAHTQAYLHGVFRAGHQLTGCDSKVHGYYLNRIFTEANAPRANYWPAAAFRAAFRGSTRKDGICPPPLVTLARLVVLSLVKNPATRPRNRYGAKSTSMFLNSTLLCLPMYGKTPRRIGMRSCTIQQPLSFACFPPGKASSMALSQYFLSTSQPSVTPFPPYSSLGFITSSIWCSRTCFSSSTASPSYSVFTSSTTRVQGTWR